MADASTDKIKVVVLGAGQDVGRSCILVCFRGKRILFDCGMHLGYSDERRFPDFRYISRSGRFSESIDCVIVSHFHLDHCGALPHLTEVCGYDGPVYMTHPTRAIAPILLQDYRKIMGERKGIESFYSADDIVNCMRKVISVNLLETVHVDDELTITAHYAGHVLGAAMFAVAVGGVSVFYTGDFNMTADRHLGGARVPVGLRPQLVISESTYGTTLRDTKSARERQFLELVHATVRRGGRVLIPVFALGRAQELMILLEAYWERLGLQYPIYFSAGMVQRASLYYELYARWGSEHVKTALFGAGHGDGDGGDDSGGGSGGGEQHGSTSAHEGAGGGRDGTAAGAQAGRSEGLRTNPFEFNRIQPFERSSAATVGPCVLFATPGMLDSGASLDAFKAWAGDARNLVVLPSYCVPGTVGHKLLSGKAHTLALDGGQSALEVRCAVSLASFSAHADAKGILTMLRQLEPRNVLLVHGDKCTMQDLRARIAHELKLECYCPQNGSEVTIALARALHVDVDARLLPSAATQPLAAKRAQGGAAVRGALIVKRQRRANGRGAARAALRLVPPSVAAEELRLPRHALTFTAAIQLPASAESRSAAGAALGVTADLPALRAHLGRVLPGLRFEEIGGDGICVRSLRLVRDPDALRLTWAFEDDALADSVLAYCEDWAELRRIGAT
jgi:integrator complex subunit 11